MQSSMTQNSSTRNNKHKALSSDAKLKCDSVQQAIEHLEKIDQAFIDLLIQRQFYSDQAVRLKRSTQSDHGPERVEQVLAKLNEHISQSGIDVHLLEKIYTVIIEHDIQRELKQLRP